MTRADRIAIVALAVLALILFGFALGRQFPRHQARLTLASAVTYTLSPGTSWQQAFQQAGAGGIVAVNGGSYQADYPSEGAAKLRPIAGNPAVTFVCGDGQPVTFASPADQLVITAPNVTIRGSCFHLNRLWIGDGPNGVTTQNVTVDGVSMWSFNVTGSTAEIDNSTIGPDVACYAPGQAASCRNDPTTNEAYWYAAKRGNTDYVEPMVRTLNGIPAHVTLTNDHFTRLQTRDSAAMHMSCLWLGWTAGGYTHITGATFDGCATDDIHVDTPQSSGLILADSVLRHSVEPVQTGSAWDVETNVAQTELQVKCQANQPVANYTITGNTFEHGWDLNFGGCPGVSFPGVSISGNSGGTIRNPAQSGPAPPPPTTTAPTTTAPPPPTTTAPTTTAPTTTAPSGCRLDTPLALFRQHLYASTLYGSYKRSNPREAARIEPWLARPTLLAPATTTETGKAIVAAGQMWLAGCQ